MSTAKEIAARIITELDRITSESAQRGLAEQSHDAQIDHFTNELVKIIQYELGQRDARIGECVDNAVEIFDAKFSGVLTVQRITHELLKCRSRQDLDQVAKQTNWQRISGPERDILVQVGKYCRGVLPDQKHSMEDSELCRQGTADSSSPDF